MLLDSSDHRRRDRPNQGRSFGTTLANLALLASLTAYGLWGLTLPRGELRVTSDSAGAIVVIDNWFRGETPSSHRLPFGRHEVVIRANGHEAKGVTVMLGPEPVSIQAKLEPLRTPWFEVGEQ